MPWPCPHCGHENARGSACAACGGAAPRGTLRLVSAVTGKAVLFNLDTVVGRRLLQTLGDPDARYADSAAQFTVGAHPDHDGWTLTAAASPNPTYVNGAPLAPGETVALCPGHRITIGPTKLPLSVEL